MCPDDLPDTADRQVDGADGDPDDDRTREGSSEPGRRNAVAGPDTMCGPRDLPPATGVVALRGEPPLRSSRSPTLPRARCRTRRRRPSRSSSSTMPLGELLEEQVGFRLQVLARFERPEYEHVDVGRRQRLLVEVRQRLYRRTLETVHAPAAFTTELNAAPEHRGQAVRVHRRHVRERSAQHMRSAFARNTLFDGVDPSPQ